MRGNFSFKLIPFIGDVLLLNSSILFSLYLQYGQEFSRTILRENFVLFLLITIIGPVLFDFYGLYHTKRKKWIEIQVSLVVSLILLVFLVIGITYTIRGTGYPRMLIFYISFFQLLSLTIWRKVALEWMRKIGKKARTIIIAPWEQGRFLAEKAKKVDVLEGILVDQPKGTEIEGASILGTYKDIERIFKEKKPDQFIVSNKVPKILKEKLLLLSLNDTKNNVEIFILPGLYEIMLSKVSLIQIQDTPVFKVGPGVNPGQEQVKRGIDTFIGLIVTVFAIPIGLIISLAIKMDSRGPIFYKQVRVGQGGNEFVMYKFRTMREDAEKETGPILSKKNDPRITRVGRFLRATRLDELPQVINVMKGEMSIVGPRPERPFFVKQFEKEIPEYSCRHAVKSGITGLAQVMSRYSTSPEDKLLYDLLYTRTCSVIKDIQILLQTIKVMLIKDRAS